MTVFRKKEANCCAGTNRDKCSGQAFIEARTDIMATHYCDKCMAPGGVGQPVPPLCNDGTGAHHFVPNEGTYHI